MDIKVEVGQVWVLKDPSICEGLSPVLSIIDVSDGRMRTGDIVTIFSSLEEVGFAQYYHILEDYYTLSDITYSGNISATEDIKLPEESVVSNNPRVTREDLILFRQNLQNLPAVVAFKVGGYNLQYLCQLIDEPEGTGDLKYLDDKYWEVLHTHTQPLLFDLCFYHTKDCNVLSVLSSKTLRNLVNMKDKEFETLLLQCKDSDSDIELQHKSNLKQIMG